MATRAAAASVERLHDDFFVASVGPSTFDVVKASAEAPIDTLVDAVVSTLSRPSPARATSAIQAACWEVLLGPKPTDVIGVSPTGSGKTLAFLLPAFASLLLDTSSVAPAVPSSEPVSAAAPAAAAAAPEAPAAAADSTAAKARAEEAMRATAASAFAEARKAGLSQEEAKAAARTNAKAAYRKALKAAAVEAPATPVAGSASEEAPAAAALAAAEAVAVTPSVLVLAPTRELCMQISAVCDAIVEHVDAALGPERAAAVASGCVVGGVDFHRQRQAC